MMLTLATLAGGPALAQKKGRKPRKRKQNTSRQDVPRVKVYQFKNVNKIPYYKNKSDLATILKLDKAKDWEALYPKLRTYIANFGIDNFYRDTYLLWRYAKLTELYGNLNDAKFLYRLVLKHYRNDFDIRKVELYYDSLAQNDNHTYVPLDYYYELVEYRKEVDTLRPPRGVLLNMGTNINSDAADYGPTLHADGKTLLITSGRNVAAGTNLNRKRNEDLFISTYADGVWSEAQNLKAINTRYNEGSACLSTNGQVIVFSRCLSPDGYGSCDLYMATLQADSTWGQVRNLGPNINSPSWDSHPALSHSGDTLFFASDRIGGFGLSDIYYAIRQGGGFGPARNIGPVINTKANDVSPYFHPVYNSLYFSSNGQLLNFGEFDIYKTQITEGFWDEPKNIGPLINGSGSEYYFTIDAQAKDLYYARSTEQGMSQLDLYSFPLPMAAQPNASVTLTGSLSDIATDEPFRGIVSIIDLDNGIEVAPKFLRPDGTFEFDLINRNNYLLILQGEEFFRMEEIFYMDGDLNLERKTEHIASKLKFESIEFEVNKADLLPSMYGDLNKVVNFLLDNPEFKLRISGHTDSFGAAEMNLDLSQRRADAIKEYIIYFGSVDAERVMAVGYGDTQPLVEEATANESSLNRRVEFEIYRDEPGGQPD